MKYLDCSIKESLRLYPSVPFIARYVTEELVLSKLNGLNGTYLTPLPVSSTITSIGAKQHVGNKCSSLKQPVGCKAKCLFFYIRQEPAPFCTNLNDENDNAVSVRLVTFVNFLFLEFTKFFNVSYFCFPRKVTVVRLTQVYP